MDRGKPKPILPGDRWTIEAGGARFIAEVIRAAVVPDSWLCIDVDTGMSLVAPQQWFIDRIPDASDLEDE